MTAKNRTSIDVWRDGNRRRVQRYRKQNKRIDYAPSPEALAIIESWLAAKLDNCRAGVLDQLVFAGHRAITGNARPTAESVVGTSGTEKSPTC